MLKKKVLFALVFSLLMVAIVINAGVGAATGKGAVVTLSASQESFTADQDVLVSVTISNPTNHSVRILKWFTPANGVEEPLFVVKANGQDVAYTGAIYKRPAATASDYIMLKAGESITTVVNLGDYYDLSASGQYDIFYAAASYMLYSEKGNAFKEKDVLSSGMLSLKVDGHLARPRPTTTPPPPGSTSYVACTDTQQATLVKARDQAKAYASESENYLLANNSGTLRYTEWFGEYTSARYNTVTGNFTALSDAWDNAGVTFNCGCKQNYYAYVYPTQPYTIYLCKVFWTAPLAGTDSKGGTLIHEMSHFNVVAGTDDYVYGQSGARALADSDPNKAINNADNHEYFAENNPKLP